MNKLIVLILNISLIISFNFVLINKESEQCYFILKSDFKENQNIKWIPYNKNSEFSVGLNFRIFDSDTNKLLLEHKKKLHQSKGFDLNQYFETKEFKFCWKNLDSIEKTIYFNYNFKTIDIAKKGILIRWNWNNYSKVWKI